MTDKPDSILDQSAAKNDAAVEDATAILVQQDALLATVRGLDTRHQTYVHSCLATMIRECQAASAKFPEGIGQLSFALMFCRAGLGEMTLPAEARRG